MALLALASPARAQPAAVTLTAETVRALALAQAPEVARSLAALEEASSVRREGAGQGPSNPILSLRAGPRILREEGSPVALDVNLALTWPLDLAGVATARAAQLSVAERVAEAALDEARWRAAVGALEALADARAEAAREALARARWENAQALVRCARVRRDAGTAGEGDVALTEALQAQARAQLLRAQSRHRAALESLRGALGVAPDAPLALPEETPEAPLAPLDTLVAALGRRPDLALHRAAIGEARADVALQRRLGLPVPRLSFQGLRENEVFAQLGVELALPVYDRNQGPRALASARVRRRERELSVARFSAEVELRAAYARWEGALGAAGALAEADQAADTALRLATRAYELGQRDLPAALVVGREALSLREAFVEARAELSRARLAVLAAAGSTP
jgi:cobalt-zinc-cadmium efflux system outer membrane protein